MTDDGRETDPSVLPFALRTEHKIHRDHFVEFYDEDATLIETVGRFVSMGLAAGDACVIIAEGDHVTALDQKLSASIELESARASGLYLTLDAQETLDRFMVDGSPDRARFEQTIRDAIDSLSADRRDVRLFGEMVSVLWANDNVSGALALEELWNDFLARTPARLFCAYPKHLVGELSDPTAAAICDLHSHVLVPSTGDRR